MKYTNFLHSHLSANLSRENCCTFNFYYFHNMSKSQHMNNEKPVTHHVNVKYIFLYCYYGELVQMFQKTAGQWRRSMSLHIFFVCYHICYRSHDVMVSYQEMQIDWRQVITPGLQTFDSPTVPRQILEYILQQARRNGRENLQSHSHWTWRQSMQMQV